MRRRHAQRLWVKAGKMPKKAIPIEGINRADCQWVPLSGVRCTKEQNVPFIKYLVKRVVSSELGAIGIESGSEVSEYNWVVWRRPMLNESLDLPTGASFCQSRLVHCIIGSHQSHRTRSQLTLSSGSTFSTRFPCFALVRAASIHIFATVSGNKASNRKWVE